MCPEKIIFRDSQPQIFSESRCLNSSFQQETHVKEGSKRSYAFYLIAEQWQNDKGKCGACRPEQQSSPSQRSGLNTNFRVKGRGFLEGNGVSGMEEIVQCRKEFQR